MTLGTMGPTVWN